MAAIFTDTSTQSNTLLSHCSVVDNVLIEVTPLFHQTLLQQAMDVHVLETVVCKFNFLNFYISEIAVYLR